MATQPRKIFVNLPVKDLEKSMTFFKALGFTFNAQFTDETAACMVISDDIYAMLLTHDKFKQFTPKAIADTAKTSEVLTCLSAESKDEVNKMVRCGVKGRRPETARTAGLWLHVLAQFPGPGRAYLGDHVDGSCQRKII